MIKYKLNDIYLYETSIDDQTIIMTSITTMLTSFSNGYFYRKLSIFFLFTVVQRIIHIYVVSYLNCYINFLYME